MLTFLKIFGGSVLLMYTLMVALLLNNQTTFETSLNSSEVENIPSFRETIKMAKETMPILSKLVNQNFFRYFRVDMQKECPITELNVCKSETQCVVNPSEWGKIPKKWLVEDQREKDKNSVSPIELFDIIKPHSLEVSLGDEWSFDQLSDNSIYIDLQVDKEQYTGYQGSHIWKRIYEENCWNSFEKCNDNKFLYKMISGMHTSVSSHLSEYFIDDQTKEAYPNHHLYYSKVGTHPERLSNLLFAVNILWRAFNRFADRINSFEIDTGELLKDIQTKGALAELTDILQPIKDFHFDEKLVFGRIIDHKEQKKQFNKYFTDITKLMDCVGCKKCKVYGKLQILGIGTALRILLTEDIQELTRNELVAFINTITKWTESVLIKERMSQRSKTNTNTHILYLSALMLAIMLFSYHFSKIIIKFKNKQDN